MWTRFQKDFNRSYSRAADEANRFVAFKRNVARAHALNFEQDINCEDLFDDPSCVFGITKFADMFRDEFSTRLGFRRPSELSTTEANILPWEEISEGASVGLVDWRSKGAVTQVKDQGDCGSCWAFSVTEEIESAVFMATGKLESLSTQQIISCDHVDTGCDGGDTLTGYKYVEKAGGLDLSSDYPDNSHISGRTGKCHWDSKKAAKVSGYSFATKPCQSGQCKHQDEKALAAALASKGPVSVCVNAGDWDVYKSGVYKKRCSSASEDMDHCVQLVGYDTSGATPYWIVRNSWAADWGEKGYMRLEMGKNLCGIANEATIVRASPSVSSSENLIAV